MLFLFSLNGHSVTSVRTGEHIYTLCTTPYSANAAYAPPGQTSLSRIHFFSLALFQPALLAVCCWLLRIVIFGCCHHTCIAGFIVTGGTKSRVVFRYAH